MLSAIQGGGLKSLKKSKPEPKKSGGGRAGLLDAIIGGAKLRSTKPKDGSAGGRAGGAGQGGSETDGGSEFGPPWNKKPPPHVAGDMFAEMKWKKQQKAAKAKWEAENGGGAGADSGDSSGAAPLHAPPKMAAPKSTPAPAPVPKPKKAFTPAPKAAPAPPPSNAPVTAASAAPPGKANAGGARPTAASVSGDFEQLKMELVAAFKKELESTKADILAQVAQMLKDNGAERR